MNIRKGKEKLKVRTTKTLTKKIDQLCSQEKEKLIQIFGNVKYVGTTADIWTSRSRSVLGKTVTWVLNL